MIAGGVGGGSPTAGPTLDLGSVPAVIGGAFSNPLLIWLLTAAGGTILYLGLIRRSGDDDSSLGQMTLAVAHPVNLTRTGSRRGTATTAGAGAAVVSSPAPRIAEVRTFNGPPARDVERAVVGYHKVRISSRPDAVRSAELGRLQRGDEVEIVDSYAGFLQVRTPDGITGWVQRHTIISASSVSGA